MKGDAEIAGEIHSGSAGLQVSTTMAINQGWGCDLISS
jgi:hypothetical protein